MNLPNFRNRRTITRASALVAAVIATGALVLAFLPTGHASAVTSVSYDAALSSPVVNTFVEGGATPAVVLSFCPTTALAGGDTITVVFPAGTKLANIVPSDFAVFQPGGLSCSGGAIPGAFTVATTVLASGSGGSTPTLTVTVPAAALSTGAGAGTGLLQLRLTTTSAGNEIQHPTTSGTGHVSVQTSKDTTPVSSADVSFLHDVMHHFHITTSTATPTAGTAFDATVQAADQFGNTVDSYTGTVSLGVGATDAGKTLAGSHAFVGGDAGVYTYTAGVTLTVAQSNNVTATDGTYSGASSSLTVGPDVASHLTFTTTATATQAAYATFSGTVTALDQFNNVATGYTGTVGFTSTDGSATAPSNHVFTTGASMDNGVHTFTNGFSLCTPGAQHFTVDDGSLPTVDATAVTVVPGALHHFTVTVSNANPSAGTAEDATVTAKDGCGNTITSYTGTVTFTSNDASALLPGSSAQYTFVGGDSGTHTFSNGLTFQTAGSRTLTATDGSASGTSAAATVTPAAATHLGITTIANQTVDAPFSVTVAGLDQYGNVDTALTSMVTLSANTADGSATLPAAHALVAGTYTFTNGVTLTVAQSQSLHAVDDSLPVPLSGDSNSFTVNPGAAASLSVTTTSTDPVTAGTTFSVTVTAKDAHNNVATGYTGTVTLSSVQDAFVSGTHAFVSGDAGTYTFTGRAFHSAGAGRIVHATDGTLSADATGVAVNAAAATQLTVTASSPQFAGGAFDVVVTAKDQYSNVATGYTGTVSFTTTDTNLAFPPSLPSNYTFVGGDMGTHIFTGGVTLNTAASNTITATDTVTASITGTTSSILIGPASASHLVVSAPSTATAGSAFSVTVTAKDAFDNTDVAYAGDVTLTVGTADAGKTLAAHHVFTTGVSSDSGVHAFAGNILTVAQANTIHASDGSITGDSGSITVGPGAATHLQVTDDASNPQTAGTSFHLTVQALDVYNNHATGYNGTVQFRSLDPQADLPSNYAFTTGGGMDNGLHTFDVTLKTVAGGAKVIRVRDITNTGIFGPSPAVTVQAGAVSSFTLGVHTSVDADGAGQIDITTTDAYGNTQVTNGVTVFDLSQTGGSGTGVFTADGVSVIHTVPIASGASSTHFFYANTVAGSKTIAAQRSFGDALGSANLTFSVSPGARASYTVTPASATITADNTQTFAAEGFDSHGNSRGDETGSATFSVSDLVDGSCLAAVCTDTAVGTYTVTADDGSSHTGTASLTVTPGVATHFDVSATTPQVAGSAFTVTVTAKDQNGNVATGYTGTVTFSSTDSSNALPSDYAFVSSDNGTHAFSVTLNTAGVGTTVTATDADNGAITGTSGGITVNGGALDHLVISPSSSTKVAGVAETYTVEGYDAQGNDLGDVTGGSTFTIHSIANTCAANLCSSTVAGLHNVTAVNGLASTVSAAALTVTPDVATHIVVAPDSPSIVSTATQAFTAQSLDQFNNVVADVTAGTTFSISDLVHGTCTLASCGDTAVGTYTVTGNDTGLGFTDTASLTVTPGAPDHVTFTTDPSASTVSMVAFAQQPVVTIYDINGNVATQSTASVSLAVKTGDVGTLSGTTSMNAVAGVADFSGKGLKVDTVGSGKHLRASSGLLTTGDSAAFAITIGPLDHLVVSPSSDTAVANVQKPFTVVGYDAGNNQLADITGTTVFTVDTGSCVGTACSSQVAGSHTVHAVEQGTHKNGTAALVVTPGAVASIVVSPDGNSITADNTQAFTAEGFDQYGNDAGSVTGATTFTISGTGTCLVAVCGSHTVGSYTVTGTDGSFTDGASLTVTAGALDHLSLSPSAPSITADNTQAFTATGLDQYGNSRGLVTGATTFSMTPSGSCTLAVCSNGLVGVYTVTGTDSGKTGTATLTVTPGVATHFTVVPGAFSQTAGTGFSVVVTALDANGNTATGYTGSVTFTSSSVLASLPSVYTFTGGDAGVHTFTGVLLNTAGSKTITATDGVKTGTSSAITVSAGPLDHLSLSPASSSVAAGSTKTYYATGFDVYGNSKGSVTGATTFTIDGTGSCSTNQCGSNDAGVYTVTGTDGSATGTATLTVTSDGGAHFVFVSGPYSGTVDAGVTATVHLVDQYGNLIDQASSVTITGSVGGVVSLTHGSGTRSLSASTPGTYSLGLSDSGSTGYGVTATSSVTFAAGAATQLSIATQPSLITLAGSAFATQPVVQVLDQYGNLATGATVTVTVTLGSGSGPLGGTTSVAAVAGVVHFAGLHVDTPGSKTLHFAASGLTSVDSSSLTIKDSHGVSATTSTVAASPSTIAVGGHSTVMVTLLTATGTPFGTSAGTVTMTTTAGALGSVTDNGDGTYTATFSTTGMPAAGGTAIVKAKLGTVLLSKTATLTATGPASVLKTTLVAAPTKLSANGVATSTLTITLKDAGGRRLVATGGAVLTLDAPARGSYTGAPVDNGDGTFTATYVAPLSTVGGTVTLSGKLGGVAITSKATITLTADLASTGLSTVTADPGSLPVDGVSTSTITVTLKDALGNQLLHGGSSVTLSIGTSPGSVTLHATDNGDGTYTGTYTTGGTKSATVTVKATVDGHPLTKTATVHLIA